MTMSIVKSLLALSLLAPSLATLSSAQASVDVVSIYFPEGRPRPDEGSGQLREMLDKDQFSSLVDLFEEIRRRPRFGLIVYGFSDKAECLPSTCNALSLRRARVVYDWLLQSGLSDDQLKGPFGEPGDFSYRIDGGDGRFNRRVGFELYMRAEPGHE